MTALARIPVDSTDARELREQAAEEAARLATARHDPRCSDGWPGDD